MSHRGARRKLLLLLLLIFERLLAPTIATSLLKWRRMWRGRDALRRRVLPKP
jgi:hypothetical protein